MIMSEPKFEQNSYIFFFYQNGSACFDSLNFGILQTEAHEQSHSIRMLSIFLYYI